MLRLMRAGLGVLLITAATACSNAANNQEQAEQNMAKPLYSQKEGDTYLYVGELSDDERRQGKRAPVVNLRFLGVNQGVYRLEEVDDAGAHIGFYECSSPCRVMKQALVGARPTREAVQQGSIIGSAFDDAMNGLLVAAKAAAGPASGSSVATPSVGDQPSFGDSAPTAKGSAPPAKPLISRDWAMYRTRITGEWNTAPVFAGHFVIIRWGCGTGCTFNVVGDHQTGRVYDLGLGGEEMQMLDLTFNQNSDKIAAQWSDSATGSCMRETFRWTGVKLVSDGDKARTAGDCPASS